MLYSLQCFMLYAPFPVLHTLCPLPSGKIQFPEEKSKFKKSQSNSPHPILSPSLPHPNPTHPTPVITALGLANGMTFSESQQTGILNAQVGEFAFVAFAIAERSNLISPKLNKILLTTVALR